MNCCRPFARTCCVGSDAEAAREAYLAASAATQLEPLRRPRAAAAELDH
jgi:hypothetical protein